ncbi:MAG TPA: hypothetical protein VFF31_26050 [Blastocatellia bacterium]|nr:hypothetical protein [Blastocatellia bacterium]
MTLRIGAALVLLFCVGGFGLAAAINHYAIVEAVNAKLRREEEFELLGWYPRKALRLRSEYRRLYPTGRLLRREGVLEAIMLLCLVLAAAIIGFPVLAIAWVGGVGVFSLWLGYFRK